jgi:hypothetical protein
MASSELAKPPMVTLGDLAGFLNSSWLARLWTYQEIMFSGNPILVCGHSLLPWWRFAMSIFFPCITKDLVDEILPANVALFNQLRRWRMLIVDRDEFQNSKNRRHGTIDGSMTDLAHYYNFLFHVALIFEKLSRSLAYDLICLAAGFFPALMAFYFYLDVTDIDTRFFLPLTILAILAKKKFNSWRSRLSHTVRRPRHYVKPHRLLPGIWPRDPTTHSMLLAAVWERNYREPRDFNFGIRNLMQTLSGNILPQLDYSSPIGEIYKDLTIDMLERTNSTEIVLAAMGSHVEGQPSWVVD